MRTMRDKKNKPREVDVMELDPPWFNTRHSNSGIISILWRAAVQDRQSMSHDGTVEDFVKHLINMPGFFLTRNNPDWQKTYTTIFLQSLVANPVGLADVICMMWEEASHVVLRDEGEVTFEQYTLWQQEVLKELNRRDREIIQKAAAELKELEDHGRPRQSSLPPDSKSESDRQRERRRKAR